MLPPDHGQAPPPPPAQPTRVERFLCLFTEVRPGEGPTALLMALNVLLVLCAYYFVKPLREGWLAVSSIEGLTKMELKAYSSFGQSVLLVGVVSTYGRWVGRFPRVRLITRVTVLCMVTLVVFWALQPGFFVRNLPWMGIVFYLWVGLFGLFVVAQFWAFAVDLYHERGERLLPLVAVGATSGAVVGSWLAERLAAWEAVGAEYLLLAALVPLAGSVLLARAADRREGGGGPTDRPATGSPRGESPIAKTPPVSAGALRVVFARRLILAMAAITLLLNWVNTNGENILFQVVQDVLSTEALQAGATGAEARLTFVRDGTTAFYGDFFFWVNLVALVLQGFVASRLLRWGGFGAIFLLLPVIALTSYATMALIPVLGVIKVMKIAENSADYSINNTARHVFWLPMGTEVTYKAKPTVDSLFVRAGDGLAALTVLLGIRAFSLAVESFLVVNVVLVAIWLGASVWLVRRHRRPAGPDPGGSGGADGVQGGMQGMGGAGSARGRLGASAVLLCLLLGALPVASRAESLRLPGARPHSGAASDADALWSAGSPDLQHALVGAMNGLRLGHALSQGQLSVSLVDITDPERPRVAAINGDAMFYAASLPKIAIMLAVFEKAERGALTLDRETRGQLERMIRRSSNGDSTALLHKVGKPFVAEVLSSDRYRLYDPRHNGGLWCGKDYAPSGLWRRDPLANLSHGATAMQVARFFYLLERGELVSPVASRRMKSLLAHSEIDHKFVRGLREIRPRASIYRKSGTWRNYHADGGIVERRDGVRYIAVALSTRHEARYWFPQIIVAMDRLFDATPKPLHAAPTTARLPDDAFVPRSSFVGH